MRSNYKRLGGYIREVNVRNRDLEVTNLLGVSIQKSFIPSIANTIGTDMSTYKIVESGQFAYGPVTSRNGDKVSIALLPDGDNAIISQAYTVFEVIDKNKLLPEYLMLWFRRPEFDRYARFKSHGSAREIFDWSEMCETLLPIPDIDIQREIVAEYEVLSRRITINEQICSKLEESAQTLYRKMFIDDIDLGNLPDGWRMGVLSDLIDIIDGDRGGNYPSGDELQGSGYCLFLNAGNVTRRGFCFDNNVFISKEKDEQLRKGKLKREDIVFTTRGTVGNFVLFSDHIEYENMRINSGMVILRAKDNSFELMPFVFNLLSTLEFGKQIESYLSGSAQQQLPIKDMNIIPILVPIREDINRYSLLSKKIGNKIDIEKNQIRLLRDVQSLLLSKLATN